MPRRSFTRAQWITLFAIWATYASFYFCRVNIGPARSSIERSLSLDPIEVGLVLGSLKIGYAIGQLLGGQAAERFGSKRILMIAMFGSVAMTVSFALAPLLLNAYGVTHTYLVRTLIALWFCNGVFQAGGWPSSVKIMSRWFSAAERGRMMGVIGTGYQLSTALTLVGSGYLVSTTGDWRASFWVPACMMLAMTVFAAWLVRESPAAEDLPRGRLSIPPPKLAPLETLRITLANPAIWVLAIGLFGLNITRYGFLDWAPGHLEKTQAGGIAGSTLKIAVFPVAGAIGALSSGWLSDRLFQAKRAPVIVIMLIVVGIASAGYGRALTLGPFAIVSCLAIVGFALYGAQVLLVGTAAQDFAKKEASAAAAGFIDFFGYLGAFSGDAITGFLLKHHGYEQALQLWTAAPLVAAVVVALLWNRRAEAASA